MRRLVVELPPSRAALWSGRVALLAAMVVGIAVVLGRGGRIDVTAAIAAVAGGIALAGAAVVLSAVAFATIWREGRPGFAQALGGLLLALLLAAWPAYQAVEAMRLPRLADVTTDVVDPPAFSRSRRALEMRGGLLISDPPAETRLAQKRAYPGLAPLVLDGSPNEAFALAQKAAQLRGWQIVETTAPGGRAGIGRIEAIDLSLVLRMPSDITVRLRPLAAGTRIDVRAASRNGRHDLGAQSRRIGEYLRTLNELAEARD
jgi:hypothetical protein